MTALGLQRGRLDHASVIADATTEHNPAAAPQRNHERRQCGTQRPPQR